MLTIDPEFRDLIPQPSAEELAELTASLKRDGCRDSLVTWNGILLDGHNRYAICEANGIKYNTVAIELPSREAACDWIDRNQLGRRNLNPEAARMIRGRMYEREKKKHGGDRKSKCQNDILKNASQVVAQKTGVSPSTIDRDAATYRAIAASPVKELSRAVMSGKMKAKHAAEIAKLPEPEQREAITKGKPAPARLEARGANDSPTMAIPAETPHDRRKSNPETPASN